MLDYLFTKTPLFFLVQSLWRDEAFSYLMAKKNVFEIVSLTAHDFSPPLYYILLHFWIMIWGHSEIALRSLSFIFFWGMLYMVFLYLRNILHIKGRMTFIYLLVVATNPLLIYYA